MTDTSSKDLMVATIFQLATRVFFVSEEQVKSFELVTENSVVDS